MLDPALWWLLFAAIAILAEIFIGSSFLIGLFNGLAGLIVAYLVLIGELNATDYASQIAYFLILSLGLVAIMYWPLKKHHQAALELGDDMVGKIVIINQVVTKETKGNVKWSGTLMPAILAPEAQVETLAPESRAEIVAFKGTLLLLKEKL